MADEGPDCGPIYGLYAAARAGEAESVTAVWADARPAVRDRDPVIGETLDDAVAAGDLERIAARSAELAFADEESATLDGPLATLLGTFLYGFGYLASFVLFAGARSPESVVARLRWAYRTVGVDIRDTESADSVERTVFRCPYRGVGAGRFGSRRVCHDVLDRVDDGYVTFLERHRDIEYDRPRPCRASECCYSEVTRL